MTLPFPPQISFLVRGCGLKGAAASKEGGWAGADPVKTPPPSNSQALWGPLGARLSLERLSSQGCLCPGWATDLFGGDTLLSPPL